MMMDFHMSYLRHANSSYNSKPYSISISTGFGNFWEKIAFRDNQEGMKQQYYEVVGILKSIKCKPQPYLNFKHF